MAELSLLSTKFLKQEPGSPCRINRQGFIHPAATMALPFGVKQCSVPSSLWAERLSPPRSEFFKPGNRLQDSKSLKEFLVAHPAKHQLDVEKRRPKRR